MYAVISCPIYSICIFPRKKKGIVRGDIVKLLSEVLHAQNKEQRLVFSFLSLNYLFNNKKNPKTTQHFLLTQKCNYRGTLWCNCRFAGLISSAAPLASSPSPRRREMVISSEESSQSDIAWHLVLAMETAELGTRRRAPPDSRPLPLTATQ